MPSLSVGDEKEGEEVRCPVCGERTHNVVIFVCCSREKGYHSSRLEQSFRSFSFGERQQSELLCPQCLGQVINGWEIIKLAREFMILKPRSCSLETCHFSRNYLALRKHAILEHPFVRPSEVDPASPR
ncbi:hypothetical protein RJ639_040765 [Escallonia herrerae]|uniref:Uncharacterized protein n=1 Tax=Escallonia herrerae TaxID=1293975 RepID=A0AA88WJ31_9ASTE|nr:hypothetical protein RJ639_040765 [Escallonia herrerae]